MKKQTRTQKEKKITQVYKNNKIYYLKRKLNETEQMKPKFTKHTSNSGNDNSKMEKNNRIKLENISKNNHEIRNNINKYLWYKLQK